MALGVPEKTEGAIDMLEAENRVVGGRLLEDGKMRSIPMDLSPGRAGEGWGGVEGGRGAHVSTGSLPDPLQRAKHQAFFFF